MPNAQASVVEFSGAMHSPDEYGFSVAVDSPAM